MPVMFWNGQVLFRFGTIAMDPACCCVTGCCISGWATQYTITIANTTNADCTDCGLLNGGWVVSYDAILSSEFNIVFVGEITGAPCGFGTIRLTIQLSTCKMIVELISASIPYWEAIIVGDCCDQQTLTLVAGASECNLPNTITVAPVAPCPAA